MGEISPSNAGGAGLIRGWGVKSPHASWPKTQNQKDRNNIVTNSIRLFKMVQVKKILKKKKTTGLTMNRYNVYSDRKKALGEIGVSLNYRK